MRLALFLLFLSVSTFSVSQDYRRFSVGVGTGYLAGGTFHHGGLLYLEPAYRIRNAFSLGLRLELALGNLNGTWNPTLMTSYSINGQYYFLQGAFRPYAGAGLGMYSAHATGHETCDCGQSLKQNITGFYPRIGVDFGHFVFDIEYNFIRNIKMTSTSFLPEPPVQASVVSYNYIKTNYLSAKVGFFFGGGVKK